MSWENIGKALAALREKNRVTQTELARRMEYKSPTAVRSLEAETANPEWRTILRYLDKLGFDPVDLVTELQLQIGSSKPTKPARSEETALGADPEDSEALIGMAQQLLDLARSRRKE